MKPQAKTALSLALAIVGGMAAGTRCDASEWVENSSQDTTRPAAYTVKAYTEGSDPFVPMMAYLDKWKMKIAKLDTECLGVLRQ